MKIFEHADYLAKVLYVNSHSIVAEFNRSLHLPLPSFGTLIKIDCKQNWVFGLIADARLKGESQVQNEEFFTNPVSLDAEIHIIPVGYLSKRSPSSIPVQDTPPETPSGGQLVYMPNEDELQLFTIELGFLKLILTHPEPTNVDLIITTIRKFSTIYPDPQSYLIRVTQELSRLTHNDRDIVQRILNRATNPNLRIMSDERIYR